MITSKIHDIPLGTQQQEGQSTETTYLLLQSTERYERINFLLQSYSY